MTTPQELHALLQQAIELARTGEKGRARALLEEVIRADEYNEVAWMWMAAVVEHDGQRREALEIVLEINPENARAREALDRLGGPRARRKAEAARDLASRIGGEAVDEAEFQPIAARPPQAEPAAAPPPEPSEEERQAERARRLLAIAREEQAAARARAAADAGEEEEAPQVQYYDFRAEERARTLDRARRLLLLVPQVAIVLAGAALVAVLLLAANELLKPPAATPTVTPGLATALAQLATATETPNPLVIVTRNPVMDTVQPPTWTPSHTPSPTATFTPSPTPLAPQRYTLLFSRRGADETRYSLYTVRGDGSQLTRLTDDRTDDRYPVPATDREHMLYVTDMGGGRELVLRTLETPPTLVPFPSASPTGGGAPSEGEGAPPAPATIPPAALEVITGLGGERLSSPCFAPDGFRIVFSTGHDGDDEIYLINSDGSSLTPLTDNDGIDDRDPAWSPDGSWIVFASDRDGPGELELYRVRPTAADLERLTDSAGSSYQPAYSPDGESIVFVSDRDRDADLYLMNADGTNERLLTRNDGQAEDRAPAFSPDGRWIAFSSNRDGVGFRLYLLDPNGEALLRVTESEGDDLDVSWLLDVD